MVRFPQKTRHKTLPNVNRDQRFVTGLSVLSNHVLGDGHVFIFGKKPSANSAYWKQGLGLEFN
jgi:hypothetical protein